MKTTTLITVTGKRWFQKSYGNTYHSVNVNILDLETNEEKELYEPFSYGYGEQYKETATDLLKNNTDILKGCKESRYGLSYWCLLDELEIKGIKVVFNCYDVDRKKDL